MVLRRQSFLVAWAITKTLAIFCGDLRWTGWPAEVHGLAHDEGLSVGKRRNPVLTGLTEVQVMSWNADEDACHGPGRSATLDVGSSGWPPGWCSSPSLLVWAWPKPMPSGTSVRASRSAST
jgi:hypothetical protein